LILGERCNCGTACSSSNNNIREIIRAGAAIGLPLNVDKCELITYRDFQVNDALLQSFKRVELEDATLLCAPLFVGAALDSSWENRCEDLARACDRLRLIGAQDALILLRASFSAPIYCGTLVICYVVVLRLTIKHSVISTLF